MGFNFAQSASGTLAAGTYSDGRVAFIPNANVGYVLSGTYSTDDSDGSQLFWRITLREINQSTFLFENRQESSYTPNESFVLGLEGGDTSNVLTGSLTGALIAGHQYELLVTTAFNNTPGTGAAATTGYVTLTFVPEPAITALVASGILATTIRSRPSICSPRSQAYSRRWRH